MTSNGDKHVVVAWNSLQTSVVNFMSLRLFRKTETNANLKLFIKY